MLLVQLYISFNFAFMKTHGAQWMDHEVGVVATNMPIRLCDGDSSFQLSLPSIARIASKIYLFLTVLLMDSVSLR